MEEKENPTIDETPKTPDSNDDAKMLLEELKKLDIQTPEQVQGMAAASAQTGKAWNEVGELRKQIQMLQDQHNASTEDYGDTLDLDKSLAKTVRKEIESFWTEQQNAQREAQMASMQTMAKVKGDPEYAVIGKVFENYINTPEAMMKLQTGETDYASEYLNTKAAYYRNLAKRSSKTLSELLEKQQPPPHVESGDSQTTPLDDKSVKKQEHFNKIKKAQKEGTMSSDQALDDIVKSIMPDMKTDPSFFMP